MSDIKAATVLTDERIDRAIMKSALFDNAFPTNDALHDFARWIERDVLAHAGVTAEPAAYMHSVDLGKASAPVYSPEQFRSWPLGKKDDIAPYIPLYTAPAAGNATKAVYWFSCLEKCARLLDLQGDEPIPSGVVAAVERLVAAPVAPAQVPAAEVRAQALGDAIEEVAKVGALWIDYSNRDTAAPILNEAIAAIRSLAQQSTADKASEVRAAEDAEYELHQDDMMVAATSGKNAYAEIQHYANQYVQDGPVEIFKVVRTAIERHAIPRSRTADSANTGALGEKGAE